MKVIERLTNLVGSTDMPRLAWEGKLPLMRADQYS